MSAIVFVPRTSHRPNARAKDASRKGKTGNNSAENRGLCFGQSDNEDAFVQKLSRTKSKTTTHPNFHLAKA